MGNVRTVGRAFFPLDRELELLPGSLTPRLYEQVVRLSSWMPFAPAAEMVGVLTGATISKETARRLSEKAGAVQVVLETESVERMERGEIQLTEKPAAKLAMSVDGAMIPLIGGKWAEVKTLAIGHVKEIGNVQGEKSSHTENLSYFSRLADATTFQRLALVETERRGVVEARAVASINDGAEWIQGFTDYHRPDALRILDFPHGAQRLTQIHDICRDAAIPLSDEWPSQQRQQLKEQGCHALLPALCQLQTAHPELPLAEPLNYLNKRADMMAYPQFLAQGWPIGSGAIESANKLVVEARLKGAGMHWHPDQVNPMLALRNIVCSDRWAQDWPLIANRLAQPKTPPTVRQTALSPSPANKPAANPIQCFFRQMQQLCRSQTATTSSVTKPPKQPYRPAANHPWRRMPIGRARFTPLAKN